MEARKPNYINLMHFNYFKQIYFNFFHFMQFYEISFKFFFYLFYFYLLKTQATHRLSVDVVGDAWWLVHRSGVDDIDFASGKPGSNKLNWLCKSTEWLFAWDFCFTYNITIILFPFNLNCCKITNLWYIDFDTHSRWKSEFCCRFFTCYCVCSFQIMTVDNPFNIKTLKMF